MECKKCLTDLTFAEEIINEQEICTNCQDLEFIDLKDQVFDLMRKEDWSAMAAAMHIQDEEDLSDGTVNYLASVCSWEAENVLRGL